MNAKRHLVQIAETHGLTTMQLYTIMLLSADDALPMHAMSIALGCDASNVTGIVDRLEAHKIIERRDNPRDRRVKMVSLTPEGNTLRNRLLQQVVEQGEVDLRAKLTATECQNLYTLLAKAQNET